MTNKRIEIKPENIAYDSENKTLSLEMFGARHGMGIEETHVMKTIIQCKKIKASITLKLVSTTMKVSRNGNVLEIDISEDPPTPCNYFVKCSVLKKIFGQ